MYMTDYPIYNIRIYDRHIYVTNTMVNAITEVLDGELKCTKTLIAFAESKFLFVWDFFPIRESPGLFHTISQVAKIEKRGTSLSKKSGKEETSCF